MTADDQVSCRNMLLRAMPPQDFALLAPGLERVVIPVDELVFRAGEPIDAVYFLERGIVTFSEIMGDQTRIGLGHTGYEGIVGWPVLLGADLAVQEARMTAMGGAAYRIASADLLAACRAAPGLHDLLLRFVRAFLVQLNATIVSSLTQSVENRLARWALMGHDRVEGDEIEVTHNEIAVMLAVRRPSVTDALHVLEGERLIQSERGRVRILDRDGLQRRAGATYGRAEAEYTRLIAPFPTDPGAAP